MHIIFPLTRVDRIMGEGLFLCMNVHSYMQECVYISVYVCWCACMYECTSGECLYQCQARFLLRLQILPRQLPHLPHTYLRHCRLTQSVLPLQRKNYVPPLEFGAKSFFFPDLGEGLSPPSPYVPLCSALVDRFFKWVRAALGSRHSM